MAETSEKEPTLIERFLLLLDVVKAQRLTRRVVVESKAVSNLQREAHVAVREAEIALREAQRRLEVSTTKAENVQKIAADTAAARRAALAARQQTGQELAAVAARTRAAIEMANRGATAVDEAEKARQEKLLDQIAELEAAISASQDRVASAYDRAETKKREIQAGAKKQEGKLVRDYRATAAQSRETVKELRRKAEAQLG